jgi:hypothetical protein
VSRVGVRQGIGMRIVPALWRRQYSYIVFTGLTGEKMGMSLAAG